MSHSLCTIGGAAFMFFAFSNSLGNPPPVTGFAFVCAVVALGAAIALRVNGKD